jgi:[acyl-carrier-protein] S-malonyltransferase
MGRDVARDFAAARDAFDEIDDALQRKLSGLMFEGDADELRRTDNAQLAVFALSSAMLAALRAEGAADALNVHAAVGHSLGHFTAATAAGVLPLAPAARIVRARGEAMRDAFDAERAERAHAMVAALPLSHADALALLAELDERCAATRGGSVRTRVCAVANVNAPRQVVLSGFADDVAAAVELGKASYGVRRGVALDVGAPFHCALMAPAADALRAALDDVDLAPPRITLLSNVTGEPLLGVDEIADDMVRQLTAPVLWSRCVERAAALPLECTRFVELGSSGTLGRLVRQCAPDAVCEGLGDSAELAAFVQRASGAAPRL